MRAATIAYAEAIIDGEAAGLWGTLSGESEAHFAVDEHDMMIGIIAFQIDADLDANINFGWVRKDHRREGIYRTLFDSMVEDLKTREVRRVAGTIMPWNTAAIAAARAAGRKETRIEFGMEIQ